MSQRPPLTRAEERLNAWISAILLLFILVFGNQLARRHLVVRWDLSEDQLFAVSDATKDTLDRLEGRMQVKAYFTGTIESGAFALAKARLEALLSEYEALSGGKLEVDFVDPNFSTQALTEAQDYALTPYPAESFQGSQLVKQDIYLGLVLRYRRREAVIPFALPRNFETQFIQRVHDILREDRVVVGWHGEEPDAGAPTAHYGRFEQARAWLGATRDVRPVKHLKDGEPVPEDIDVLFVVRPTDLHRRAVFEIDQFVQRGGSVVVLVDQVHMTFSQAAGGVVTGTGMEDLLTTWGAPVADRHIWDVDSHGALRLTSRAPGGGTTAQPYPLWPRMTEGSFHPELPPTSALTDGVFIWAQPLLLGAQVPEGVTREVLASSSAGSYLTEMTTQISADDGQLRAQSNSFLAGGDGRPYAIAAALSGRFPSPFTTGAPHPWDPISEPTGTTDEPVLSAAADAHVVVIGDSDWIRDGMMAAPNRTLMLNLVDWLTLDDALIALRSRTPKARPVDDFLEQERERLGIDVVSEETLAQADLRIELEQEAMVSALWRRRWAEYSPVLVTALLVLLFGLVWNLLAKRVWLSS